MNEPILGIAKKLYRVWCEGQPSMPPWDGLTAERQNCWVQVASAACITALRERDAEIEGLRAQANEDRQVAYKALNDETVAYNESTKLRDQLRTAREALIANHTWHQEYDDYGGYIGSELEQINTAALEKIDHKTGGK